jgi:hypothetical protein
MPEPQTLQEYLAAWLEQTQGVPPEVRFASTNEFDAQGRPVVHEDYGPSVADAVTASPWTKAQTIGAPQLGEHYTRPTYGQIVASDRPIRLALEAVGSYLLGDARPPSLTVADPYGIDTALAGKGHMPAFLGSTAELPQAQSIIQSATPEALGRLAEQFPAFATDLAHYRTGQALPPALGHLSDALVQTERPGVYALKPEVQARIAHFLELGKSTAPQANWQGATSAEILKAFDNDPELADIWARMVGATSAGTGVPRNTQEAVQGMRHYLMTDGKAFTERSLETMPGGSFGLPGSKYSNMNLAQLQEALSGDKVEAFAQLMRDYDRIPLDRHAVYALGGILPGEGEAELARHLKPLREYFGILEGRPPKYKTNGAMYDTVNKTEAYERVEQAFADTLRALEPDQPLKDVFAQMWEGVREQRGGKFQGGPIDLMGPRGLLERGAMADPKQMLRALRMTPGKEWTPAMWAAFAALGGADALSADAPPAGAAPPSPDYSGRSDPTGLLARPYRTPR